MNRTTLSLLILAACSPDLPDCPEGYVSTGEGLCLSEASEPDPTEPPPATIADLLDQLDPCQTTAPAEPLLDLTEGCYAGVCAGETHRAFLAAWGEPAACEVSRFAFDGTEYEWTYCTWEPGIEISAPSIDGVIDPASIIWSIDIELPNSDLSSAGSGVGAQWRCLVDELGLPRNVSLELTGPIARPTYMSFGSVIARDYVDNAIGLEVPDGLVDSITIYGF